MRKTSSLFQKQKEKDGNSVNKDNKEDDLDPLDDFFNNLGNSQQKKEIGDFSSEDSENVEEKAKSFIQPYENDEEAYKAYGNAQNDSDNEPEYVLPPDHSKIKYEHFGPKNIVLI